MTPMIVDFLVGLVLFLGSSFKYNKDNLARYCSKRTKFIGIVFMVLAFIPVVNVILLCIFIILFLNAIKDAIVGYSK